MLSNRNTTKAGLNHAVNYNRINIIYSIDIHSLKCTRQQKSYLQKHVMHHIAAAAVTHLYYKSDFLILYFRLTISQ